jgi:hypothetical protein
MFENEAVFYHRHCEQSEAIQPSSSGEKAGLLRRKGSSQ